jgi:hypothetical protein
LPTQETFQNRITPGRTRAASPHHKDRCLPTQSGDFAPSLDRLTRFAAIPGALDQISIGYPITSGMRTIQSGFSQIHSEVPMVFQGRIVLLSDGLNTLDRWYGNGVYDQYLR